MPARVTVFGSVIERFVSDKLEHIASDMEREAKHLAPAHTGRLREHIVHATNGLEARVWINDVPYAHFVLYGTEPVIEAKSPHGELRFTEGGETIFRRRVRGARGNNFMKTAFDLVWSRL